MNNSNVWTPKEVRRTMSTATGIILIIGGIFLLYKRINATGTVDIKSAIFNGKIESGSAGLITVFLGITIMLLSNATPNTDKLTLIKNNRIVIVGILALLFIILTILAALYPEVRVISIFVISSLIVVFIKLITSFF
ncbi:hypothetical protein [Mucilaginibacter jinjuensis]|uniref:Tripartite tricarboxylate transporter TctB family protein n=1 Tax=Mucilaginibacter jinjuensis TaxID=1176721 RepID=A0ABY7TBH5_9SPHI|nr:hypothetical protein [Mucilaginibacter jinjuensis]WCT13073.1 hypothetical protein PQO05_03885 [Mucilaginibacter jinjuensis]